MISLICELKYDRSETIHTENRLVVGKGDGVGEGWMRSFRSAESNYYI